MTFFFRSATVALTVLASVFNSFSVVAGETYTSQTEAGFNYKLQGEYMGVVDSWGGTWGAQVIANGEQKIAVHLLEGGLPGQGFKGQTPTKKFNGEIDSKREVAEITSGPVAVTVKPIELSIMDEAGKKLGVLTKVIRESKTLGLKAPENAIVLFAVGGDNHFKNGKTVENGYLGVGCTSAEVFGDHHLHIEFRTPFQPSDTEQKRGNSGVYLQGRYEVQILDSFGLSGEDNECGGIYKVARPRLNMCYPPLTWQTYDIDFTAARYSDAGDKTSNAKVTVRHNGVVIHDNLELPNATPGKDKEANNPGPLYLQDHKNHVAFRNIWVQTSGLNKQ